MKRISRLFFYTLLLSVLMPLACTPSEGERTTAAAPSPPVKLVLDTDFGSTHGDIDDMGALAVAHGLMNQGACDLQAVMLCINNGHAVQAVDAVNTYFGRGDIPVANADGELMYQDTSFAHHVARRFAHDVVPEETLSTTPLYRKLLAEAEPHSMTVAVVGNLKNIHNLLISEPDDNSPLSGRELVEEKVDRMYVMGGAFPTGITTVNFQYSGPCIAKFVVENFPRPIVFSGTNIGRMTEGFVTGSKLNRLPDDSPVKACFQYWFKHPVEWYWQPPSDSIRNHHHWDQITVHTAVRGVENWFELETEGSCEVECDGSNIWNYAEDRPHAYLKVKMDPFTFSNSIIEPLMMALPE